MMITGQEQAIWSFWKRDFPIFSQYPHTYLDSAATTHKPQVVIDAISDFYTHSYGSVHRGLYALSSKATAAYESARVSVQQFIGALQPHEIVFTAGATAGINLVARGMQSRVSADDNVVVTQMEHHANFIPWQQLCRRTGASLRVIPLTEDGELDVAAGLQMIDQRTQMVAMVHLSNVLGGLNDLTSLISKAREHSAWSLVDAAQSIAQMPIDVQALSCDFMVFSGHKVYGPTGIGVLYGRYKALEDLEPDRYGGDMIVEVTNEATSFRKPPHRFEGGSPHAAGVVGLVAALNYLQSIGMERVANHTQLLSKQLTEMLLAGQVDLVGNPDQRYGVVSFMVPDVHPHDVATILAQDGIAVRAGHHCAQPLMRALGTPATVRASFGLYNSEEELQRLLDGLHKVQKLMA